MLRRSYISCAHQDPETPKKLIQNYVWVSPEDILVSTAVGAGALGAVDPGMA